MAYFPLFIELNQEKCLIIGDGPVARRKAASLESFGAEVSICRKGSWQLEDCLQAALVIAATDDREWNHLIATYCHEHGILVNVADSKEESSFLFPSVLRRGPISVGITSSGQAPKMSSEIRKQLEEILTEESGIAAENLGTLRRIMKQLPIDHSDRKAMMDGLYEPICQEKTIRSEEEIKELALKWLENRR